MNLVNVNANKINKTMIKTTAIGHLGGDCNLNNVNGKSVINFSVAHSEKFKDAQGVAREKTLWINCAYWTDRTGIAPYLKKGTLVYVEGQPEVTVYSDRQGKPQAEFKLRVSNVQLLGGNKDNQQGGYAQQVGNPNGINQPATTNVNDITEPLEDLPF